jgi:vacuolar-type H+-ATPase subunit H
MENNQLAELLQAEKKAETLRARSKEDSLARVEKAHKDAESLLKRTEQEARSESKEILEHSKKNSQKEALEIRSKGQAAVVALRNGGEKNTQKAVTVLMDALDSAI